MRVFGKFALVYVLAGEGTYAERDGPRVAVRAGDLIIVWPDVPHVYGPPSDRWWQEFYIVFSGPVFDAWRSAGLLDPRRAIIHLEPVDYWLGRMVATAGDPTHGDLAAGLGGTCRLQQLLADLATAPATGADDEGNRAWLIRARSLIDAAPPGHEVSLEVVARQMRMSPDAFRKRFARLAGITPSRYRAGRTMDAAAALLIDPADLTLRDVADRCGFCDAFHFSKRFKQIVGVSPAEFRRRSGAG